ncbi:hypothetical protein KAR91_38445 [Candidatus Pacearchaeota archaeon]|nr:hypothetical protein [Candidatus Pacearchaeota archaeon]
MFEQIQHFAFQYYGLDWVIAICVFVSIFLLGNEKKNGFAIGVLSSGLGLVFSFQIGSIANGIMSAILIFLYMRGYFKWVRLEKGVKAVPIENIDLN